MKTVAHTRMDEHEFQRIVDGVRDSFPVSAVVGNSVKLVRAGNELKACCPFHPDRSPSFTIYSGDRRWHCFGCGRGGDVIDYTRQAEGVGVIEAIRLLDAGAIPVVEPKAAAWPEETDRTDEALAIWQAAVPIAGTVAERYLRRRAITIELPDTLRFARVRLGKRPIMPALVALVANAGGAPCGIQRTFLTEDGSKADLPGGKVKFSLGRVRGGAIRLGPVGSELAVCEGLEDGLSLLQLGAPSVFVAAGSGMMPRMELPGCVADVVIGGDADDAGRSAADAAAEAFAEQGRRVRVIYPASGFKDFNAELSANEMEAA